MGTSIIIFIILIVLAIIAFKFLAGAARTIISLVLFILAIGLAISLFTGNDLFGVQKTVGAAVDTVAEEAEINCCEQCIDAFSKSPAAIGPEGAVCGKFSTAQKLSTQCEAYFQINPTTVAGCS